MSSSINTNIAAYYAQANISAASQSATASVARLSSGNAIVQASDNVAALATGTSLATQVSQLRTAQGNASQGSSLLQVADGALAQIQSILQQQESLALQAESGALTNTDRGFLNQQFAQLTSEINSLAAGTTFNGVNLIDGSIAGGTAVQTNITNGSTSLPISAAIGTIGSVTTGDTFTLRIGGQPIQTFTFGGTSGVGIGATAADSAANLAAAINNSGLSQLANLRIVASGANLSAYYTGSAASLGNIPAIVSGTNASTHITSTGTASFTGGSSLGTITGTIQSGDQFTIGSHTVTFTTSVTTTATNLVAIGASTSATLDNLKTYLNAKAGTAGFTDLANMTFSDTYTTTGTGLGTLYGIYTGAGATQPTLTTTYTPATPTNLSGNTNAGVSAPTSILTLDSNSLTVGASVITVGNASITVGSAAANPTSLTTTVDGTGSLSATLTNIVSYLNNSTVNAALSSGYAGAVFSTDGTSLYMTNPATVPTTGITTNLLNGGANNADTLSTSSNATVTANSAIALGWTGAATTTSATVNVGGVAFSFAATTTSTGAVISDSVSAAQQLTDIQTYLSANSFTTGITWSITGTNLFANNVTTANINVAKTTFTTNGTASAGDLTNAGGNTVDGLTQVLKIAGGGSTIANGTVFNIGGQSITVVASGAGAGQINNGTNATVLSNLITYLNTNKASLSNGLANATFTTGGTTTSIYVDNKTDTAITGVNAGILAGTPTGGGVPTGATLSTTAISNFSPADNAFNVTGGTLAAGETLTIGSGGTAIVFHLTTGSTSGTAIHVGAHNGAALDDMVTYLNSKAGQAALVTAGYTGLTFSTSATATSDTGAIVVANSTGADVTGFVTTDTSSATVADFASATITHHTGLLLTTGGGTSALNFSTSTVLHLGTSGGKTADITFVASSPNTTLGQVQLGTSDADTLANLAAYLNSTAGQSYLTGTSYHGIKFTTDGTNHLYVANTSGGSITPANSFYAIQPNDVTVSSSKTLAAPATVGTISGGGIIGVGDVMTFGTPANNTTTATIGTGSTVTINGHAFTFTTSGGTGTAINIGAGGNNFSALTALATYLNGTDGQALLTGSTLAGATFTTDGTHLIATNNTGSNIAGTAATNAWGGGGATPTGATSANTTTTLTTGATHAVDVLTMGIETIVFGAAADTTQPTGLPSAATLPTANVSNAVSGTVSVANALSNAATYLNALQAAGTTASGLSHTVFSSSSSQLFAQQSTGAASNITIDYTSATSPTFTGVTNLVVSADTISGLGAGTTSAVGTPTGSLFVTDTGTTGTNYGTAVDLSHVANNINFLGAFGGSGTIGAITATYINTGVTTTSGIQFSVVVGNDTYTTNTIANSTLTGTSPVAVTFTGSNTTTSAAEGGSFTLNLQPQATSIASQNSADQLASGLNAALSSVSAYQNRNVLSFNNNYSASVGTAQTATLAGSSLAFNSDNFTNPLISSLTVSAPGTGSTDAKISAVINGDTYSTVSGIGDTFAANAEITLQNQSNPKQTLTLTLGANGSADLTSASNASAFQTALSNALGLSGSSLGLTFQLGTTASSNVNVTIGNAQTTSLFGGAALDISTQAGATTAAAAVATAIDTVTSIRAGVGALESQFNFASAALQSSVQNEDAARSLLLDTNIATESTSYATSQVKLQAGISVLAQANQQLQALLKLIG